MLTYPEIDPVLISLGPLHIRWYSLAYLVGITLPFWVFRHAFRNVFKFSLDDCMNYVSYLIIGTIIGGRLGYVLFYDFGDFLRDPLMIVAIWQGGMSYHGGALGCIGSTVLFARHMKVNVLALLDILAIGSTIGIFLGRIANFINGELYGRVTTSMFGMVFPGAGPLPRHPSQLYEAFCEGVLLFLLLWAIRRWMKPKPGIVGGCYLIFYGGMRFVLEFFREPDAHIGFVVQRFSLGQVLCFVEVCVGVMVVLWIRGVVRFKLR